MAQFRTGQVVQLKSGGPRMTVTGYSQLGNAICEWFKPGDPDPHSGTFPDDALRIVNDGE